MCYKDEKQKDLYKKFEEKSQGLPEFIKEYFILLTSNTTKLNNLITVTKFLNWLISQEVIKNTIDNINPNDLKNVTDIHMIKYLDGLKNGLYGVQIVQSSANTKMNVIRGFWSYLIDKEYVTKNIVNKIVAKKYKIKDKKVNVPTDEEVNDFLNNLENIKNEYTSLMYLAIAKLFLGSGIRLEELVGMDIDSLHFENDKDRYIMIMGKGEYEYTEPTKVNINQSAYIAIDDYLKVRNADPELKDIKALFISNENKRLSYKTIQGMFSTYSNKTIHPHLLRHYVGTKIYENGDYDIKKVQKQLRHKDINTSIKYYVGNDEEELKNVLDSF